MKMSHFGIGERLHKDKVQARRRPSSLFQGILNPRGGE
ncbi:uncharacterized protein FFE2_00036 [Fusarium fujikuroi]|nr:uncharacterized protein FFE2_00036 [Fusarium fujikuroi]